MYESPITLMVQDVAEQMIQQTEQTVLEVVRKCGIDVDKEELIKALNYDREQYQKGYHDGLDANKWIPVSERLPEDGTWNLFTDGKKISVERYKSDAMDHFYPNGRWFSLEEVVAWMPLPEPYLSENPTGSESED